MSTNALEIRPSTVPGHERILTPEALEFVAELTRAFRPRLRDLLGARVTRQDGFDRGVGWDFLEDTKAVRDGDWTCAPPPADLEDRRVEITGPVDRKMVINALNSGANVFMADFEDSTCPTWDNVVSGQINLFDAVRRTITFDQNGKHYELSKTPAVLFVRPRGLHLPEAHVVVDGEPVPGAFFDFGLFVFHNAKEQLARGTGPYFYLPKLESHLEARLWNDVLTAAERHLGLAEGTCRATVLIETLPAAFQMHEILHELRTHSVGLNCGRWDYIFSAIKRRQKDPSAVMPDRAQITMDKGFLRAYSELLIQTCHRRGVHAMGGMAAQIPIKDDAAKNEAALARVRADKQREARAGHDGTWVAHPALVPIARAIFDAEMPGKNQLDKLRLDVKVNPGELLAVPEGTRTSQGLRHDVKVSVQYIEAWLRGIGCVPLYNLMEDAATAEISRAQVWQRLQFAAPLDEGTLVLDETTFRALVDAELAQLRIELGPERYDAGRYEDAKRMFVQLSVAKDFEEFLTLPAYDRLLSEGL